MGCDLAPCQRYNVNAALIDSECLPRECQEIVKYPGKERRGGGHEDARLAPGSDLCGGTERLSCHYVK